MGTETITAELAGRNLATNGDANAIAPVRAIKTMELSIKAPNFLTAEFNIVGTAPYVQQVFSRKAFNQMRDKQAGGQSAANKKPVREAKDFDAIYRECQHFTEDGKNGIPASAFRKAMIDACRMAGYKMTEAKMTIFVMADGIDQKDAIPLVKFTKGMPSKIEGPMPNDNGGMDIRVRAKWDAGWEMTVRIRWDGDQLKLEDVTNLLMRAGMQVGVGEGRPFSKNSCGMGWGTFELLKRPQ